MGKYGGSGEPSPGTHSREEVVRSCKGLVELLAIKLMGNKKAGFDLSDLISEGYVGLLQAIDKFDSSQGASFRTFAEYRITGCMKDFLRSLDQLKKTYREREKQIQPLLEAGKSVEEIAQDLHLSIEVIEESIRVIQGGAVVGYLEDLPSYRKTNLRNIWDSEEKNALEQLIEHNDVNLIREIVQSLPLKHRLVIQCIYFEDMRQEDIARVLDVVPGRISQIHRESLDILKKKAREFSKIK